MINFSATLDVRLIGAGHPAMRVGLLTRDDEGNVRFTVDDSYIERGSRRPILSMAWNVPGDEAKTIARLYDMRDKRARLGALPPWFDNLLPEGALRDMVERGMRSGRTAPFDVIARLGQDLPGAVVVGSGVDDPSDRFERIDATSSTIGPGRLRFSLAGIQLKFSSTRRGDRLTLPAQGETGDFVVKLPNKNFRDLPEIEYASMRLAQAAGVQTAECDLLPSSAASDIPADLRPGPSVLAIRRFDRVPGGRIHIEDFSQILGAIGNQKYTRGNEATVIKIVRRFAKGGARAAEEAVRRIVINILLGNTDAHLKNWSLIFRDGHVADLSPAYDIVAIQLLNPGDPAMALKLHGSNDPRLATPERFGKFSQFVGFEPERMKRMVRTAVGKAAEIWSVEANKLPLTSKHCEFLRKWWRALALTEGTPSPF